MKRNVTSYSCCLSLCSDKGMLNIFMCFQNTSASERPGHYVYEALKSLRSISLWWNLHQDVRLPLCPRRWRSFPFEPAALPVLDVTHCFSNAFSDSWAGLKRQTSVLSLSIRIKYFFWLLEGLSAGPQLLHNYNTMHLFAETEKIDVKQWRQRYVCIRVASVPSLYMVFQLFYWRHYPAPSGYITINSSNTLGF